MYVTKCPRCGEPLTKDDIDFNFNGNQDEYSICNHCHYSFVFYIRYHHLWKYEECKMNYDEEYKNWFTDGEKWNTVIVYKKEK